MSNYAQNPCRSVGSSLSATTETAVYTAGAYAQVVGVRIANKAASDTTATLSWYSSKDDASYVLVYQAPILAHSYAYFPLEGFALISSDEIRVTAGAADALDVVLTVVEIPGRSG